MPPRQAATTITSKGSGSSPSNSSGNNGVAKLRRSHRKSRNGCLECKRRHIKCDEGRPACSNCIVGERLCSFPPGKNAPRQQQQQQQNQSQSRNHSPASGISQLQPHDSGDDGPRLSPIHLNGDVAPTPRVLPSFNESFAVPPPPSPPHLASLPPAYSTFTAQHLILLHHAEQGMDLLNLGDKLTKPLLDIAISRALDCPYAIDQLLAISADHLAMCHPSQALHYQRSATELQTRALTRFNREAQEITQEMAEANCVPRFLFSSLLSLHMLYVTFAHYRHSFHEFIDCFINSVNLHRGVRAMIGLTYNLILDSPLRPFLAMIQDADLRKKEGTECLELEKLIDSSDLGPSTVTGCKDAVERLQWAFNVHASMTDENGTQAASAFPVLLSLDYVNALRKHHPEALVILAHYGVLLHRCRSAWIFGDAGAFLIRLIADRLGPVWQDALRWPLEVLETENG